MSRIPDEIIIEEIIPKIVEVKSLLRFQCVSKSWFSSLSDLISNKTFHKKHLQISMAKALPYSDQDLISMEVIRDIELNSKKYDKYRGELCVSTYKDLENAETIIAARLYEKKFINLASKGSFDDNSWFVGCSNGLSCLCINEEIYLWNPCTRKSYMLPDPSLSEAGCTIENNCFTCEIMSIGFGSDEFNDDYKVLVHYAGYCLFNGRKKHLLMLYNLKNDCWKILEHLTGQSFDFEDDPVRKLLIEKLDRSGKLLHGKLHWGSKDEYLHGNDYECNDTWGILSFDLKSEEFGVIEQQGYEDDYYKTYNALEVVKECLCTNNYLGIEGFTDFWIMAEYGVKESWYKAFRFDHERGIPNYPRFEPLCMTEEFEILGMNEETFIIYNPITKSIRHPKTSNSNALHKGENQIQSLMSPFPEKRQGWW